MLPQPEDYRKTVYVIHAPPYDSRLDLLQNGHAAGSRALRYFIEEKQSYLTLHGHIHESPYSSGTYISKIGSTVCINPGQEPAKLHAVSFELPNVESTIRHTIFDLNRNGYFENTKSSDEHDLRE